MIPAEFEERVFAIIKQIPRGKVTTYGQIAYMAKFPRHSRLVGSLLKKSVRSKTVPCHRVVNSMGRLVPGWEEQRYLLEGENVPFKPNGYVNLKLAFWQG